MILHMKCPYSNSGFTSEDLVTVPLTDINLPVVVMMMVMRMMMMRMRMMMTMMMMMMMMGMMMVVVVVVVMMVVVPNPFYLTEIISCSSDSDHQ